MNKLKLLLFTVSISIFFGNNAFAATAEELVLRDLQPSIKLFEKDIRVYHYFYAPTVTDEAGVKNLHPQLMYPDSRNQWIQFLIKNRTGVFWDLNYNNTDYVNAGPGMYFAIDPHSSKEFGDTAVAMLIKKEMKFLSVFKPTKLMPDTLAALVEEGIIEKNQLVASSKTLGLHSGFSGQALKNMLRPENLNWRKFIIRLFTKQNIQFVEYLYQSHLAGFCKIANQAAFVYVGQNPKLAEIEIQELDQQNHLRLLQLQNSDVHSQSLHESDNEIHPSISRVEEPLNSMLISQFSFAELTPEEARRIDLINRFKSNLKTIREKGVGVARKLFFENMSEDEMNELADESYKCTRRHK